MVRALPSGSRPVSGSSRLRWGSWGSERLAQEDSANAVDGFLAKLLCRIALLPLITGVSYELIRFAAKRRGSVLSTMTAPGLWLQRITTKPQADDQAAVAIRALEGAMALEEQQGGQLVIA